MSVTGDMIAELCRNPKVREGLEDYVEAIRSGFTGTREYVFAQGVPQLRHNRDTKRFGGEKHAPSSRRA